MIYNERNGGRCLNVVKPISIWGEKKGPNTAILLLLPWLTVTDAANYETSSVFMVGLCWSAQSSFCVLLSLCPTSSPSQKSPAGLYFPLQILSVPKHTRGIAMMFGSSWFNLLVFFVGAGHTIQTSMWIHKHLLLMEKIPKRLGSLVWAIYCCQLQCWLPGKLLYSKKMKTIYIFLNYTGV